MPKYLVTMEAEGIAYPFFIEAREQGRAIVSIKRYWESQDWGDYDAIRIETLKQDRDGIARPMRFTPQVYSRVAALVHNCWLDTQDGQGDRDHILRQLCQVLTEVLPASIAQEVFEIVAAHERAGHTVEWLRHLCAPYHSPKPRSLHKKRWRTVCTASGSKQAMPKEEQQMQEQAAQDLVVEVLITPAADRTITPETLQALANDLFDEDMLTLPGAVVIGPLERVDSLQYLTDVVWLRERHATASVAYIGNRPEPLLDTMQALADGTHDVYLWCSGWNRPRPAPPKGRRQGGVSGRSGTEVALVALARPQRVHVWDRELSQPGPHELLVQHYLLISGKWPPFTFDDALVEATIQKHFGLVKHHAVYS